MPDYIMGIPGGVFILAVCVILFWTLVALVVTWTYVEYWQNRRRARRMERARVRG